MNNFLPFSNASLLHILTLPHFVYILLFTIFSDAFTRHFCIASPSFRSAIMVNSRALRADPIITSILWCMTCLRVVVDSFDAALGLPFVVRCVWDGIASTKCHHCAGGNKSCEQARFAIVLMILMC